MEGLLTVVCYVLIDIIPGYEYQVYSKLTKVVEIIELYPIFGEYDLIAKIISKDIYTIGNIVIAKIRTINGVINTTTLTGMDFIAGL
jgi:DNA-binding Lrp family transcriptional regulator